MKTIKLSEVVIDEKEVAERDKQRSKAEHARQTRLSRIVPRHVRRVFARLSKLGGQRLREESDRVVVAYYHHPEYPRRYFAMDWDGREEFWGYIMESDGTGLYGTFTIADLRWIKDYCGTNVVREPCMERDLVPLLTFIERERQTQDVR